MKTIVNPTGTYLDNDYHAYDYLHHKLPLKTAAKKISPEMIEDLHHNFRRQVVEAGHGRWARQNLLQPIQFQLYDHLGKV